MKEYQFQYTKIKGTFLVVILAIAVFILTEFFGIYVKLNVVLTIILSFVLAVLVFQLLKRKAVYICTAKLSDTSIKFEFDYITKEIIIKDLISFKSFYGKNGPVLYLNTDSENFQLSANNNFCKTDDFKLFCDDVITQLNKYKDTQKSDLIHRGSIFATKGMLYFLIVATLIYLFAFLIETKTLMIAIGIGGGFYLLIMWLAYFNKRDLKSK